MIVGFDEPRLDPGPWRRGLAIGGLTSASVAGGLGALAFQNARVDAVSPIRRRAGAGESPAAAPASTSAAAGASRYDTRDRVELSSGALAYSGAASPFASRENAAGNNRDGSYGLGARALREWTARRQFATGGSAADDGTAAAGSTGATPDNRAARTGMKPLGAESENASPAVADGRSASGVPDGAQGNGKAPADASAEGEGKGKADGEAQAGGDRPAGADGKPLSDDEMRQLRELESRDDEVRQHEQAHVAAGGSYITHGARYEYQQGPDGQRYAVGGEVGIDTSAESDPERTIRKMRTVRAAALAPAEPSSQDRAVAASATQQESAARVEMRNAKAEESQGKVRDNTGASSSGSDSEKSAAGRTGASASLAASAGGERNGRVQGAVAALEPFRAAASA